MRIFLALAFLLLCQQANSYQLYLVRHFEKASNGSDPELTSVGHCRAAKLAEYLRDKPIQTVLSTQYQRTLQSAAPTAKKLERQVQSYDPSELGALANKLKKIKSTTLIVGHSNTTPTLITALGGAAKPISELDYGELFILDMADEGQIGTQSVMIESCE